MWQQRKKGQALQLLFAGFVIVVTIILFYAWMGKTITARGAVIAEEILAQNEMSIFFSELVREHGRGIADNNANDAEKIIENYAKNYIALKKGGYSADCKEKGTDKECELTIKLHETLSTVLTWSAVGSGVFTAATMGGGLPVTAVMITLKLLATKGIIEVSREAYLPKSGQATKFKLSTVVEFA